MSFVNKIIIWKNIEIYNFFTSSWIVIFINRVVFGHIFFFLDMTFLDTSYLRIIDPKTLKFGHYDGALSALKERSVSVLSFFNYYAAFASSKSRDKAYMWGPGTTLLQVPYGHCFSHHLNVSMFPDLNGILMFNRSYH